MLGYLMLKKPCGPPHHHKHPEHLDGGPLVELLRNEVGFSDDQIKQYEELKRTHREKVKSVKQKMKPLRESYFDGLVHPVSENETQEILNQITTYQVQIEKLTFQHFQSIRSICTHEEQIQKYNQVIQDISKMVAKPPKPHK